MSDNGKRVLTVTLGALAKNMSAFYAEAYKLHEELPEGQDKDVAKGMAHGIALMIQTFVPSAEKAIVNYDALAAMVAAADRASEPINPDAPSPYL